MSGDQLGALQVTNTGTTPLWVRLDSTGYPEYAPQPSSNVLQVERHIHGNRRQYEITLFAEERRAGAGVAGS